MKLKLKQFIYIIVIAVFILITVFPIFWALVSSLRSDEEIFRYAMPFSWRTFVPDNCFILIFVDGVMTLMALDAWYSRMAGVAQNSPVSQFFATYFNDDFMAHRFQTMKIDPSTAGRM